jgi:hypothetical protein
MKTGTLVAIAAVIGVGVLGVSYGIGAWQAGQKQPALSEAEMANRDHNKIINAIEDLCRGSSPVVRDSEATTSFQNYYLRPVTASIRSGVDGSTANAPTTFQETAVDYSAKLRDQRINLDQQIRDSEARLWWFQVLVVVFGGLATIAVGLKPVWERLDIDYVNVAFAAGAIIFSALVTAVSSLSAVTTNQNDILHHQRTLAQLQQLHWRVGNDVFAATKLCAVDTPDIQKIGTWKDRFEKITNDAMPMTSQPGDLGRAQDPVEDLFERLQKAGFVMKTPAAKPSESQAGEQSVAQRQQ